MEAVFIKLFNMSITATWIALAVILIRLLFKKAPKHFRVFMWGLVGLRLLLPFSIESILSLIPSAETVPPDIIYSDKPVIQSGIPVINSTVNPIISESLAPATGDSVNPMQVVSAIAANIWVLGMALMVLYAVISYMRIWLKVKEAARVDGIIWECDNIDTPFILGIIRPKIYLPSTLTAKDREYVIAHERAHLKRRDHFWKPLGFLLLTVYWFNPVLWAAYVLLCKDIELATDEKVIKALGEEIKKPYSEALINCSVPRKAISACPVAFGESGVKERVKAVLNYKKASFWMIVAAIISCIVLSVFFLTDPADDGKNNDSSITGVGGIDPPSNVEVSTLLTNANDLKKKFPEYFGLDTTKGLEVYIWQLSGNSYSCGLMSGTNRDKTEKELSSLKSASIPEMRAIIDDYDISKDNVTIIPIYQSYSSYHYVIDEEYTQRLIETFWENRISCDFFHGDYKFDLPYTSCTILEASFTKNELLLTIKWETEEGFTESTKVDYPEHHVKFTVGENERFTFTPLPNEWTGDGSVVTSLYSLTMPINIEKLDRLTVDLYLNDDKTFVRNLIDIFLFVPMTDFNGPIFDSMDLDIDGDGVMENCTLGAGPTYGLYTFTIKAFDGDGLKYCNTFLAGEYSPETFYKDPTGKPMLKCIHHFDDNEVRYYDITLQDGRIVLRCGEETFGYWGKQGTD